MENFNQNYITKPSAVNFYKWIPPLLLLALFCVAGWNWYFAKPHVNSKLVINTITKVQQPTVVGNVVKWTVLVKRSEINNIQHLLLLPVAATNITIKNITKAQGEQVIALAQEKPQNPVAIVYHSN